MNTSLGLLSLGSHLGRLSSPLPFHDAKRGSCRPSPFHAAIGILTCRMMIHLRKFSTESSSMLLNLETSEPRLHTTGLIDATALRRSNCNSLDSEVISECVHGPHDEENIVGSLTVSRLQPCSVNVCFLSSVVFKWVSSLYCISIVPCWTFYTLLIAFFYITIRF